MRRMPTVTSRFVATVAAATAALATVAAACASETPTSQSAASEPTSTATAAPSGSTTLARRQRASRPTRHLETRRRTARSRRPTSPTCWPSRSACATTASPTSPTPDPTAISCSTALGIDPDSPQFKAAQEACSDLMPQSDPAGPNGSGTAGESDWEKVVPGGDCMCADGSEFAFWERRADPTKVVFYLDGGGSCFDATTCAFTGDRRRERLLRLQPFDREPGPGGWDLRLRPGRQPVRRLLLHLCAAVHR